MCTYIIVFEFHSLDRSDTRLMLSRSYTKRRQDEVEQTNDDEHGKSKKRRSPKPTAHLSIDPRDTAALDAMSDEFFDDNRSHDARHSAVEELEVSTVVVHGQSTTFY